MKQDEFNTNLREYGYQMFAKAGDSAMGIDSICDRDMAAALSKSKVEEAYKNMREALEDAMSGMRYIRKTHGELYGVDFDRVEQKAMAALNTKED